MPFLLSALLIVVALYLRFKVEDSPVFQQTQEQDEVHRLPLGELLRHHGGTTLLAGLASAASPAILPLRTGRFDASWQSSR